MSIVISLILTVIISFISFYVTLPAINLQNPRFWIYIISIFLIFGFLNAVISSFHQKKNTKIIKPTFTIVVVLVILYAVLRVGSSSIFHSNTFANRIQIQDGKFEEDIPTVKDLNKIPLMDSASASILGNRVVGSLTDLVSQYNVSGTYTTISYNGSVMKISPLVYEGFFKYMNNKSKGIPGYVLVNTETNEAQFIRLDKGIQYSPSGYFSRDLNRKLRFSYPTKIFGDTNFQIDNEGTPYWVTTCVKNKTLFSAPVPNEVIVMNAVTGDTHLYSIKDTPEWIDYVFSGPTICKLYDAHGKLQNGYFNSIFGQKNCTQTTDDYGYVVKGEDVYVYTGVTSTVSDESNLGFIMVNSRTGEYVYYQIAGAEEYSAMSAAEGAVQNYGYHASFPALINVSSEPTYALVLKDDSGLVKLYAMINVKNYTIVATGTTMNETLKLYRQAMSSAGTGLNVEYSETTVTKKVKLSDIQFLLYNNETVCYMKDASGNVYKQNFNDNESLIRYNIGDVINIVYDTEPDASGIYEILEITE